MFGIDLGNHVLPEMNRLCVGIINAKNCDSLINPEVDDPQYFIADARIIIVEINRINILILLWWVFCVSDRSIRAGSEPFWICRYPRMIGGGLKSEI